jgi:hypothetical protein
MFNEPSLAPPPGLPRSLGDTGYLRLSLSMLLLGFIGVIVCYYPITPLGLAGFLVIYGGLLWRYPNSWLFWLPALLPVLDFTPWTGRFFFDEFDLVVLTTVAVQLWHKPQKRQPPLFTKITFIVLCLYGVFYAISLLRGLLPLQSYDANAFSNYYSHYNSLRVGKGVVWGVLLLPMLKQSLLNNNKTLLTLSYGILAGLSGVIIIAILERFLFAGLFDFSNHYRINALFSTMHTGGGHIESYLMLSLPFIAILFSNASAVSGVCGISLFIAGLYVLLVTFSRGGYIGFVIGFLVLMLCLMLRFKGKFRQYWQQSIGVLLLVLIVPLLATPVFQGQLIQQRFSIFSEDKAIRTYHWLDSINMMDESFATTLLGMGIGSYPRTYFWLNTEKVTPATYKIENETANQYLRLRSGDPLYMGQMLGVTPHTQYHVQVDARTKLDNMTLSIFMCEKSLLFSLRCSVIGIPIKPMPNSEAWQHIDYPINTGDVGEKSADIAAGLWPRPVQLTLSNGNGVGKVIDIDNIKLLDTAGKNLIVNGDFSKGSDRWFFTAEKHHPWHILNLWVHVFFDQGLVGLVLFVLLLVLCAHQSYKKLTDNPFASIFLSALCAFSVVGWVDSPFDAPRITLLFFLMVVCSLANVPQSSQLSSKNAKLI